MENTPVIQEFLNYLSFEKRFSEHTAKCYGADLRQFGYFLATGSEVGHSGGGERLGRSGSAHQQGGVATALETHTETDIDHLLVSADIDSVRNYMAYLTGRQQSKSTIARKLATLRSFYKFLVKRNIVKSNPVMLIRTPKQERKLPKFLEYEEVKRLLETPPADTWLGSRDRAIMETLYSTGVRVSELVGLNLDDVDFLSEVVHIRGKGKKERIVPIGSSALQSIQHYMEFATKGRRTARVSIRRFCL